jgi:leucyl-tRNA synthetase
MWRLLGHQPGVALAQFSNPVPELLVQNTVVAVAQVDGKFRDRFEVSVDVTEDELKGLAFASENVQRSLAGKEIANVIVRAPKLVNIATR